MTNPVTHERDNDRRGGGRPAWVRRTGTILLVAGTLVLLWTVVVWRWEDPFTALYTAYEQHSLASSYDRHAARLAASLADQVAKLHPSEPREPLRVRRLAESRVIRDEAHRYRLESRTGEALGRILVPRLGLHMIFVDGTNESSLEKGPGRDLRSFMPGEGRLVYIAGHRTTFLAPFSDITALRRGDPVTLELPYGTFVYRVTRHVVVPADDMAVLRPGTSEVLALQACHPRFFATHRYIVYARPVEVVPANAPALRYRPRGA